MLTVPIMNQVTMQPGSYMLADVSLLLNCQTQAQVLHEGRQWLQGLNYGSHVALLLSTKTSIYYVGTGSGLTDQLDRDYACLTGFVALMRTDEHVAYTSNYQCVPLSFSQAFTIRFDNNSHLDIGGIVLKPTERKTQTKLSKRVASNTVETYTVLRLVSPRGSGK